MTAAALLVILALALLFSGPVALVLFWLTRRELRDVREREARMEQRLRFLEAHAPMAAPAPPVPMPVAAQAPPAPAAYPRPAAPRHLDLETLVGGQWLTWIGILAIFFGTAFFLAYNLGEHPMAGAGQVLTGLLVGALFIAGGMALTRRREIFLGRGLLGGGVALLYLSAYASYAFHHLVSAPVVFPFLFGAALIGAFVALTENSLMVASLTLAGAILTPLLLSTAGDPTPALFPYLGAVTLGTVLIATRRRWPILTFGGFFGTVILVARWWFTTYTPDHRPWGLFGVGVLWLAYALIPLLQRPLEGLWSAVRGAVVVATGLLFEFFLYHLMSPEYNVLRGMATATLALAYLLGARLAGRLGSPPAGGASPGVRVTHYTGLALAVLAIPIQFDLAWVTLGWALLGLVLLWTGVQYKERGERWMALAVYALAVFRVLLFDTVDTFRDVEHHRLITNGNFVVGVATAGVLGLSAWLIRKQRDRLAGWERRLVTPLILVAAALLLWRISVESLVWYEARAWLTGGRFDLASLLTLSLIWAVYSGLLILAGFLARYRPIRILGIGILGVLLLKVFALDMRELERGYRIASFVGVGLLLLLISILYQRERRT